MDQFKTDRCTYQLASRNPLVFNTISFLPNRHKISFFRSLVFASRWRQTGLPMIGAAITNTTPRKSPPPAPSNHFAITFLTNPTSQLPSNHIVAKNIGGGVPFPIPKPSNGLAEEGHATLTAIGLEAKAK
jgi:hypothetical protein